MHGREHGQVLPLVTVVIVVAGVVSLAAVRVGGRAVEEAQAATAADAAALAGAAAGAGAAAEAAEANGARLTGFDTEGADTRASVATSGGAGASARARRSGSGPTVPAPALRAALARAAQLAGGPVPTLPPTPGGPAPGDSAARHQRGLAVDVPPSFVPALLPVAAGAGLCQPYPGTHPNHFELCPPPGPRLP